MQDDITARPSARATRARLGQALSFALLLAAPGCTEFWEEIHEHLPDRPGNEEPAPGPDASPEPQPDASAEVQPDASAEPQPDASHEPQPDAGLELQPDAGPDLRSDAGLQPQPDAGAEPVEVAAPRVVTTHQGGVLVIDGSSLAVVDELPLPGFLRLNPAGNHRHLVVSTGDAFRFLDTGVSIVDHGDHAHYYAVPPELTDIVVQSQRPGHVTHNAGTTALFSDGSGRVELFDPTTLESGTTQFSSYTAAAPHHGVAVALALPDDGLLVTVGTETARTGAMALDAARQVTARSEQCPGVHGETVAQGGAVALGCQDGVLVYRDGAFHKIPSPDPTGAVSTQVGSEHSTITLGDYYVDPNAEFERPERVALIDTRAGTMRVVDLGTSYSWRSLARGPDGEALVLGTDGAVHVIDPQSGQVVESFAVVAPWSEPTDWQEPRPVLKVVGSNAYVTEPATSRILRVDLASGQVVRSAQLPHVPNELSGAEH